MVLRPIELNAPRNPRAGQTYKGGLDNLIVVDKVVAIGFVHSHMDSPTYFWQQHDLEIAIFQKYSAIFLVSFCVGDVFDNWMRVYDTTTALINAFL